ncbi:uncharacterized protein LOC129566276 [Sitodiplosis mosellana]|uniref:uncharacterized protein LOC129566276 n=1 Tax=Sitodiplosis mosellana TaxID=263140 RepID=UPI00244389CF|nr:uncharacterized protein LOC129566276 [Sitodiplosis mosellana]
MNRDDVIPPSPQLKEKKSRSRSKNSKTSSRQKKQPRSILSLRMKKLQVAAAENSNVAGSSSGASPGESHGMQVCDIYAGIDDVSAEEKNHTISVLSGFDILGQPKLIEQCNRYDMTQARKTDTSQRFSQTRRLISLKELLSSQDLPQSDTESPDSPCAQGLSNSGIEKEARDVSCENFHFSEWPHPICNTPNQPSNSNRVLNLSLQSVNESLCSVHSNDNQQQPVSAEQPQIKQSTTHNEMNASSFVQSILDDFDSGDDSNQEVTTQLPPLWLVRRTKRKMYDRTRVARVKQLLDDSDMGLNLSFSFRQNLTDLATGLTQSNSCDFVSKKDSLQTITISDNGDTDTEQMSMVFYLFVHDQKDDFLNADGILPKENVDNDQKEIADDTPWRCPKERKPPKENDPSIHLLNLEDDIFANIETPKASARCKAKKPNLVSTPLSTSTKGRSGDSVMYTTPSTSKQAILSEQRIPKRLHFGAEMVNHPESPAMEAFKTAASTFSGFATARGKTLQMSTAQMKRTAAIFADIDEKYKEIDPTLEEVPSAKKVKHGGEMVPDSNRISDPSRMKPERNVIEPSNQHQKFGGFGKASGASTSVAATKKALNLFGEDFSDFGFKNQPQSNFKPSNVAGPSGLAGFATARGSNIKVSADNMLKYANTLKEVDRGVREEFGIKENINLNDENLLCKTPLGKLNQRTNAFATSTPNPNSMAGFKNYPPITPITKNSTTHDVLYDDNDELFNEISTQPQKLEPAIASNNTSVNLNDTSASDFQLLNVSVAGVNVLNIPEEIKCEREKALNEQQVECFKKPRPIRPLHGSIWIQRLLEPVKLQELGQPKKCQRDELERLGVPANIIELSAENVLQFKFDMWKFYSEEECHTNVDGIIMSDEMCLIMDGNSRVGIKELTSAFLNCPSVDPTLVPDHWIKNAIKWIFLKLASYERSYPHQFSGKSLTPENVLVHLKYRYDQEIDNVQRSAIQKIVEKDDSAAKRMVLFVSRILDNNLACTLELSDGWYSIKTSVLDAVLTHAVINRKIVIGTKLVIQGAEVVGFEEACSPLEMPGSVALKIQANSTRRARWFAKLGFCKETWPFAISLNSVKGDGGVITRMKAYVLRVYPLVFMVKQKVEDGHKTVFRSNKVEQRQNKQDDKKHLDIIEKLYAEANAEVEKEYEGKRKKSKRRSKQKICDIEDGEELWNYLEDSNDSIEMDLSTTQIKLLEDYQTKLSDEKQNKIKAIVHEKLIAMGNPTRSVSLQKLRLIDATSPCATKSAILSIWNAGDAYASLRENTFLDLHNVTANGVRGKDLQLTASNFTSIRPVQLSPLSSHATFARKLTPLAELDPYRFHPHFNEFDTLGFVLKVEDIVPNFPFQSVFIVDAFRNILCIKFWGNIQQHAYDDIVRVNKFLVISQLEWRPHNRFNRTGVTQAFVTELTTFSESPKLAERSLALDDLREKIEQMDMNEFIEGCCNKLGEGVHANKENSTSNISSNSTLNQSMVIRTGAIASPAIQSPTVIMQKVDRLRHVGSPPPFRSSYLQNGQTPNGSRKPFKTPSRAQQSTSS